MGWTAPRDWTVGEVVTEDMMDTHVKNNLRYLKGLDGVPTIESGLIIDNTGGDEYLQIPSLTTAERDALTPVNGMIIYNETIPEFNKYENAEWKDLGGGVDHGGLDGLADDDHTQYQLKSLLTTQGDMIYATGDSTWVRLAKGTSLQSLRMNSGATAPEWAGVGATLIVAETEVFNAAAPVAWTDLDLSGTIGANTALVLLKIIQNGAVVRTVAFRKNGDTDEFYLASTSIGCALGDTASTNHAVFLVATDSSGVIEWITEGDSQPATIDVMAYIK